MAKSLSPQQEQQIQNDEHLIIETARLLECSDAKAGKGVIGGVCF